jgi:diguanylate cyclase (GGDEF)-like protein
LAKWPADGDHRLYGGAVASSGVKRATGAVDQVSMPLTADDRDDAAVQASLAHVAGGLAVVLATLAVVPMPALGVDQQSAALAGSLGGSSLALGALALVARRHPVPPQLAHPVAASALVLVIGNAVLAMVVTGQPRQTIGAALAVVAAGAVLLSWRWLAATLYLAWGLWGLGAFVIGPRAHWLHHAAALAGATVLAGAVNWLRRTDVRREGEARAALDAAAVRDQLTGLANRRGLAMVGAQMVEQARRQGDAVHAIFVDIDGLKAINDAFGTAVGDEVIVAVAEALRGATRGTDVVARWGGDEFCVVGPGPGMAPLELERRMRDHVELAPEVPDDVWPVRVSAGGAMLAPWDSGTLETLLGKADQEMYLRRSLRKERAALPQRRPADTPPAAG